MEKFKKGDRVQAIIPDGDKVFAGAFGTVINSFRGTFGIHLISVEFDEYMRGHDNLGTGKTGHCWDCLPCSLKKINQER
jgi:hypothetical protein